MGTAIGGIHLGLGCQAGQTPQDLTEAGSWSQSDAACAFYIMI
jgi:hypothetical protein